MPPPRVKICGITRDEDLQRVTALGFPYAGIILVPESPRFVALEQCRRLLRGWAPGQKATRAVLVVADADADLLAELAQLPGIAAIQFHGNESRAVLSGFRQRYPQLAVWRSVRCTHTDLADVVDATLAVADQVIVDGVDADRPELKGGTGKVFPWSRLEGLDLPRVGLAGGLRPDNIAAAAATGVALLDLASGVESAPGVKDAAKLDTLARALATVAGEGDSERGKACAGDKE